MNQEKLENLKQQVLARAKALVALLGVVLFYLQVFETARPNHYLSAAIMILTVLGVHQTPNKEIK